MSTTERDPVDQEPGDPTQLSDFRANLGQGSIWTGILRVAAWHAGVVGLAFLLGMISSAPTLGVMALCFISLVQLLYVVPLTVIAGHQGRTRTRDGIFIAAGITFLLNATCFGMVMYSLH